MNQEKNQIQIIINADDLGWNQQRDDGIFELLKNNQITSATAMVNGYNSEKSIKYAKENNFIIGLHLNLTEGQLTNQTNQSNNTLVSLQKFIKDEESEKQNLYIMHGKMPFRQKINDNLIDKQDIETEIRAQINKFIELYGSFPSHIDGHMHIHTIPFIAEILAPIMSQEYGIYKTRIAEEQLNLNLGSDNNFTEIQTQFYNTISNQSQQSRLIYQNYGIVSTNYFMGMLFMSQNCQTSRFQKYLEFIIQQKSKLKQNITIEIMCHPGYPSINFGCEFNKSNDRVLELETYKSQEFQELIKNFQKINYKQLLIKQKQNQQNILIYSSLTPFTGNFTSSLRLQNILKINHQQQKIFLRGHNCFKPNNQLSIQEEIQNLEQFIEQENIEIIFGINVFRSGVILHQLNQEIQNKLKIIYVISGTDANEAYKNNEKLQIMQKSISNPNVTLISHNIPMKNQFINNIIQNNEYKKEIEIIPQTFDLDYLKSINIKNDQKQQLQQQLRQQFSIPQNQNIILLTAGIRPIKDVTYTLNKVEQILDEYQNYSFIHVGPILDKKYYEQQYSPLMNKLNQKFGTRMQYIGTLQYYDYLNLLIQSKIIINSSLSEGMCTAIVEAMFLGVCVLARSNEGNKQLIQDNFNGFLFDDQQDFYEKCKKIIENKLSQNQQISQNAFFCINSLSTFQDEVLQYQKLITNLKNQ